MSKWDDYFAAAVAAGRYDADEVPVVCPDCNSLHTLVFSPATGPTDVAHYQCSECGYALPAD